MKRLKYLCLCLLLLGSAGPLAAAPVKQAAAKTQNVRDFDNYFKSLSAQDQKNITFIITTLSDKSVFQLMFYKKSLEESGDKVNRVHPLRFLVYVFSDKTLKNKVKSIGAVPWRRFVNDMGTSLSDAVREGEMKPEYIESFAKSLGLDRSAINPLIKGKKWRELINYVKSKT